MGRDGRVGDVEFGGNPGDGGLAGDVVVPEFGGGGDDLLSVFVTATDEEAEGPTEAEIQSQLMTFLFAGYETSATALTWALYELGRKPAVADRLSREFDGVVDGACATLADLPDLEYTEQVLREILRRYPPAAAIFREADADVTIGGYHVPADTFVVLPQFHVHTDDRWWADPDRFDPARWDGIADPPGDRPEYAHLPFGGGPHHCIGMRFARMELTLALATIARQCRVAHDHDEVPVDVGSTVHPGETIRADVRRRQ